MFGKRRPCDDEAGVPNTSIPVAGLSLLQDRGKLLIQRGASQGTARMGENERNDNELQNLRGRERAARGRELPKRGRNRGQ